LGLETFLIINPAATRDIFEINDVGSNGDASTRNERMCPAPQFPPANPEYYDNDDIAAAG
jgi:hypothetical protein